MNFSGSLDILTLEVAVSKLALSWQLDEVIELDSIEKTIGALLSHRASVNPDLEALVGPKRRFTYAEFEEIANRIGHWLLDHGVRKGERVMVFSETNVIFPLVYFGAAKIGAITVAANWRWTPELTRWAVEYTEPTVIFYDESFRNLIHSLNLNGIQAVQTSYRLDLEWQWETALYKYPATPPEADICGKDPVCITFTSGTTGRPKGVVITHNNIYAAGIHYGFFTPIRKAGHRLLYVTPLFHISGTGNIGFMPLCGYTFVFMPQPEPELLLETIERERVNSVFLVPAMLGLMLPFIYKSGKTLRLLEEILTAGSPVPEKLIREYETLGFNIVQGYGMTECTGNITIWFPTMGYDTCASVGKPFMNEICILDHQTREVLPPGKIGELAVRGPIVFKEYWRDPDATRKAFHNGWFLSGDAARMDERGFVYIVDRYKDVIYISGFDAIYPSPVEAELRKLDGVSDVALIGVQHQHYGEISCAFIVRKPEAGLTHEQVLKFVHSRMEKHKVMAVHFVEQIPRNDLGKVDKAALKKIYQETAEQT
ncbi:MAG: AMP-binding protein [Thermoactinomyces sp.]